LVIILDVGDTLAARLKKEPIPSDSHYRRPEPIPSDSHYRRPLEGPDLSGVPLGHEVVPLQREQFLSPIHSLSNVA
jgi:hypothetical protein